MDSKPHRKNNSFKNNQGRFRKRLLIRNIQCANWKLYTLTVALMKVFFYFLQNHSRTEVYLGIWWNSQIVWQNIYTSLRLSFSTVQINSCEISQHSPMVVKWTEISGTFGWPPVIPLPHTLTGMSASWGCRIRRLHLCRNVRPPTTSSALDMTLNYILCCGSSPRALGLVKYLFPWSTVTRSGSTC